MSTDMCRVLRSWNRNKRDLIHSFLSEKRPESFSRETLARRPPLAEVVAWDVEGSASLEVLSAERVRVSGRTHKEFAGICRESNGGTP